MSRSFGLKVILLIMIVSLCVGVPIIMRTRAAALTLGSVFMVGADDGWAVGEAGTTIHWNGTDWNTWTSSTTEYLSSVFMVSSSDGWAVGRSGTIIRWNGTVWNPVTSPTTSWLRSVFMDGADDGWAVGEDGTTIHWNGSAWNTVPSPTVLNLWSVFMVKADDVWAVGEGAWIIRWNGTDWDIWTSPKIARLHSVFMVGADDGWAVGEWTIRWNGSSWSVASPATSWLWSVFMVGADDGWAVGEDGTILRWNGTDWSTWTSPTTADIRSVFMVSSSDGWAVGGSGTIIRWNGTGWILARTLVPVVSVDPPIVSASPGGNFTVDVKITNVKNLYSYQFKLSWDPTVLEVQDVQEGDFLSQRVYKTQFQEYVYNEAGYLMVVCFLLGEPATAAVSGSGTLATIEFIAKEEGNTSLHLHDTMLLDPFLEQISHGVEAGYSIVIPEFPSASTLLVFMATTLPAVMVYRRKHSM